MHRPGSSPTFSFLSYSQHSMPVAAPDPAHFTETFCSNVSMETESKYKNREPQTEEGVGLPEEHLRVAGGTVPRWVRRGFSTWPRPSALHPQHFQETHGPAVTMGVGQSAVLSKLGSRMAGGAAIIFMMTRKGDWKRFQVSINMSSHGLNLFHCLFQQVANMHEDCIRPSAVWLQNATQRRDVSLGLLDPPIQCRLPCTLHPSSPFSEIPLAFKFVLKCLFSESLLFAK